MKKRIVRSPVILDNDDLYILHYIISNKPKKIFFGSGTTVGVYISEIEKALKISHKGLLIHFRRLIDCGLLIIFNDSGKNYKRKLASLTMEGIQVYNSLRDSDRFKSLNFS